MGSNPTRPIWSESGFSNPVIASIVVCHCEWRILSLRAQRGDLAIPVIASTTILSLRVEDSVIASVTWQSRLSGTAKPKERLLRAPQ